MTVCGKTEIQQGKTDEEKRKFEQDLVDLKAKDANAKKLSADLAEQRKNLQKLYDEAKKKADQAVERGFALQMVGAILGPIAQGVGAFAGAMRPGGVPGAPSAPPPTPTPTSPEKTAAEKKVEEAKTAKTKADNEAEQAKKDLETANEAKRKAAETATSKDADEKLAKEKETTEKTKADKEPSNTALKDAAEKAKTAAEAATKAKEAAEKEKKTKEEAAAAAEKTEKEKREAATRAADAVTAAGRAVETAAKNLETVGAGLMDIAKQYEAEKEKYLDTMLKYQEQEAQALASMAEYAVRMTNVTSLVEVSKTVSQSLCQAIASFNAVAQILRNAALFWTQMADACKALASGGVQSTVKAFSELPLEVRLEEYKAESFKIEAVGYMAQWKAMELICGDYSKAAGETRSEIQANIIKSPSPEESMKLTPELGRVLLLDARRAEGAAQEKSTAIKKEMQPKAA
jgi:DNA repair exonuclease SbcCD ATPase subunit